MKKIWCLILILINIPLALADFQYNSEDILTEVTIGSKITLIPTETNNNIKFVTANISLFPRESLNHKVSNIKTTPQAIIDQNSIFYRWDKPTNSVLPYLYTSNVRILNNFVKVEKKVNFPLTNIPKEVEKYIKPAKNIDSNNEDIIQLASEIAHGQDDAYVVLFLLAEWVESSIEYSLDTLTEDASQKASWVLENRYGVCDELTSLFIALARTLGFPAKFVSGLAYTNYNNLNDFGPHAWAEVYLPDYGWIPFDITYGEFGWIDPTHIKFKESTDSDEPAVNFQWLGVNINLESETLSLKSKILKKGDQIIEPIQMTIKPFRKEVGIGSYNIIETEIKNLQDNYRPVELFISRTNELRLREEKKHILLKPNEVKTVYWVLNIDSNLDQDYIYTFPVSIASIRNTTVQTQFKSSYLDKSYTKEDINNILDQFEKEELKVYSRNIDLICITDTPQGYLNEKTQIECDITNRGNTLLENVDVCIGNSCKSLSLGITQTKTVIFQYTFSDPGINDIKITADNKEVSKTFFLPLVTLDKPNIKIGNIDSPNIVKFQDLFTIKVELDRNSISQPKNVEVLILQGNLRQRYNLEFDKSQDYTFEYPANILKKGENNFQILVKYESDENENFEASKNFKINLENPSFFQKISGLFHRTSNFLIYRFA